jgi:prepilin-type N-terminal cleavage/methylation domain-containing protein
MSRSQRGFTLVELLIAVLIVGVLSVIAVATFRGTTKTVRAEAVVTDIDTATNEVTAWGNQMAKDEKFGTASTSNAFATLNATVGRQIAPNVRWTDTYPPAQGQLFVGPCTSTDATIPSGDSCGTVVGCLEYFKSGKQLCLEYQTWPRGGTSDPTLRTRRMVRCNPACTVGIYDSATNGRTNGSLTQMQTATVNNPWPQMPATGRN